MSLIHQYSSSDLAVTSSRKKMPIWISAIALLMTPMAGQLAIAADTPVAEPAAETKEAEQTPAPVHVDWTSDLAAAQKLAQQENKDLLLFFTGSDWCAFCIKLEEAVLTKPETADRISEHFIPVVLDFPARKKLPADVKQRNDELKAELGIRGFPTLCAVDADMLPYGSIVGYKAPDAFWISFDRITSIREELTAAKDGTSIPEIEDVAQLNQVLATLPEDVIKSGWNAQLQRMVELSSGVDDAIHQKWSDKLTAIQKEKEESKLISELITNYSQLRREKDDDKTLEYLNQTADKAQDYPNLLRMVLTLKGRFLFDSGRVDEALELATQVTESESFGDREKAAMRSLKRQIEISKRREKEAASDADPAKQPE